MTSWVRCRVCGCELVGLLESDCIGDTDDWCHQCRSGYNPDRRRKMMDAKATLVSPRIAGALYDFLGYLTTRAEPLTLSRAHEAPPALDALVAWAETRGLSLERADVLHWHEYVTEPVITKTTGEPQRPPAEPEASAASAARDSAERPESAVTPYNARPEWPPRS